MFDEPRRRPWLLIIIGLLAVGSVPFPFIGRPQVELGGLPLWLWVSLALTVALAVVTALATVRYWKDDSSE